MSKAIAATCVGGLVKVGSIPIPTATILSDGVGESEGILIIDQEEATYLADTTPDLDTTLGQVSAALGAIADALTAIGTGMTGATTAPPGSLPGKVTAINAAKAQIDTLRGMLR